MGVALDADETRLSHAYFLKVLGSVGLILMKQKEEFYYRIGIFSFYNITNDEADEFGKADCDDFFEEAYQLITIR